MPSIVSILERHHEDYPLLRYVAAGGSIRFGDHAAAELRRRGWVYYPATWIHPRSVNFGYSMMGACREELGMPDVV